jgi:hypothetical protein
MERTGMKPPKLLATAVMTTAALLLAPAVADAGMFRAGMAIDPRGDVTNNARGKYDIRSVAVFVDDRHGRIGVWENGVHTPVDERPLSIGHAFTLGHTNRRGQCSAPLSPPVYQPQQPGLAGTARVQYFTDDGPERVQIRAADGLHLFWNPADTLPPPYHILHAGGWVIFQFQELRGRGWDCIGQYRTDGVQGTDTVRGFRLWG